MSRWLRRGGACIAGMLAALALCSGTAAEERELSPELRADIGRLMEVTRAADMGRQMGDMLAQQIVQLSNLTTPESVARCRVIAAETIKEMLGDDGLLDDLVPVYARNFSHQDVRDMIAFYETPLGLKTLEVMPKLMQESMQVGQQWALRVMPGVQEKVTARLKAEGFIE